MVGMIVAYKTLSLKRLTHDRARAFNRCMKQKNNTVIAPEHITWLRSFAEAKGGVSHAASLLGMSRSALTRALAALPIHRGTAAQLKQQIAERTSTDD